MTYPISKEHGHEEWMNWINTSPELLDLPQSSEAETLESQQSTSYTTQTSEGGLDSLPEQVFKRTLSPSVKERIIKETESLASLNQAFASSPIIISKLKTSSIPQAIPLEPISASDRSKVIRFYLEGSSRHKYCQFEQAVSNFEKSIKVLNKYPEMEEMQAKVYNFMGKSLIAMGTEDSIQQAMKVFKTTLSFIKVRTEIKHEICQNLSILYLSRREYNHAIEICNYALSLKGELHVLMVFHSLMCQILNEINDANAGEYYLLVQNKLTKVVQVENDPNVKINYYSLLGSNYMSVKDYGSARTVFETALTLTGVDEYKKLYCQNQLKKLPSENAQASNANITFSPEPNKQILWGTAPPTLIIPYLNGSVSSVKESSSQVPSSMPSAQLDLQRGKACQAKGRHRIACEYFQEGLDKIQTETANEMVNELKAKLHDCLGNSSWQLANLEKAVESYHQVLELSNDKNIKLVVFRNLVIIYWHQQKTELVSHTCRSAIALEKNSEHSGFFYMKLGDSFYSMKNANDHDYDKAIENYTKAINEFEHLEWTSEISHHIHWCYRFLGWSFVKKNMFVPAINCFNKVLSMGLVDQVTKNEILSFLQSIGLEQLTISQSYNESQQSSPSEITDEDLLIIGSAYPRSHGCTIGEPTLREAVPPRKAFPNQQATINESNVTIPISSDKLELANTYMQKGKLLLDSNKCADAKSCFLEGVKQLENIHPDFFRNHFLSQFYCNLGEISIAQERLDIALDYYNKALELNREKEFVFTINKKIKEIYISRRTTFQERNDANPVPLRATIPTIFTNPSTTISNAQQQQVRTQDQTLSPSKDSQASQYKCLKLQIGNPEQNKKRRYVRFHPSFSID